MTEPARKRYAPSNLHSLVVPVDLTPSSDRVVGRVALLPLAEDARVTLLHVIPRGLPPREQDHAERDATRLLADEVRHLRRQIHKKATIEPLVKVGSAPKEIAAVSTKLKAQLIVMGRGGGRVLRDAFLGSTAERVVRQARLPVLVVRLAPRRAYSRPALAAELDHFVDEAVRLTLKVLPIPRPRVDVIHAFSAPYGQLVYPSVSLAQAEELQTELRQTATRKLTKHLSAAISQAGMRPEEAPFWKLHVRHGSARGVVERVLKRSDTDLLALGTRGYTGAAYVFLGTIAGDLLRTAKCDVLMVPPSHR